MSNDLDLIPDAGGLSIYQPAPTPVDYSGLPVPDAGFPSQWMPDAAAGASDTLFGQAMPPVAAQQVMRELEENFSRDMSRAVPAAHARLAVDLFKQMATAPMPRNVAPAHRYDLSGLAFLPADHPFVHVFCNAMAQRGLPQASVYTMLRWYHDLTKKVIARQQQQNTGGFSDAGPDDISDKEIARQQSACLAELSSRWGHELPGKLAVVRAHMKRLPGHLRDHLEFSLLPGNLLSGNHPDTIEMVYREACGLESAPSAKGLAQQIDEIEHVLRTDRKRYNRDPMMQARYRELLHLRDG